MSLKIMAVDDSASIRQMVLFSLKKTGYEVAEAANGRIALESLRETQADLVITDLDMPEMNGIELTRNLRALPAYRTVPIVLLTTESAAEKKQDAKSAGATGWITKPFTPAQLVSVVEKLLP
ncbi:response regulator [Desulfonema ishimotonii]|uniref:Response regulator n=1 Tax=Desulfonema ishimotonii TaxID=45657 RepID=A0A401FR23_9BACT|nr:response regulator [Desulfonema ishimotonii]GBC59410.1 response regulator [Desulfonema ishimotonii]